MTHNNDKTLIDLNRRNLSFKRYDVKEILPEFFREEYPKLITLLDQYYHFEDTDSSPSKLVNELFINCSLCKVSPKFKEYETLLLLFILT